MIDEKQEKGGKCSVCDGKGWALKEGDWLIFGLLGGYLRVIIAPIIAFIIVKLILPESAGKLWLPIGIALVILMLVMFPKMVCYVRRCKMCKGSGSGNEANP